VVIWVAPPVVVDESGENPKFIFVLVKLPSEVEAGTVVGNIPDVLEFVKGCEIPVKLKLPPVV
jgi:hypothetical protein